MTKLYLIPPNSCGGNCQQGRNCDCAPQPAEACTEVGAEPTGRARMGVFHAWERSLLSMSRRPGALFAAGVSVGLLGYAFKVFA